MHTLTDMSDWSEDFRFEWLKRRRLVQRCAFLGFRWYCCPFSMNRPLPSKCTKYWNFYIIKTTAWIRTKFCTVIKVQICPQQIQDGEWPPSWKIKNTTSVQSATHRTILMKSPKHPTRSLPRLKQEATSVWGRMGGWLPITSVLSCRICGNQIWIALVVARESPDPPQVGYVPSLLWTHVEN